MSTTIPTSQDVQAILDAGKALGQPITNSDARQVILIPNGYKAEALEKFTEQYRLNPVRIKTRLQCTRAESFIGYVNEFKEDYTKVFVDLVKSVKLVAVIDYHHATAPDAIAMWCDHLAVYEPPFTPEWQRITGGNKRRMNQLELLEFLEENQALIISPSGASLLELVGSLEGKSHARSEERRV